MMDMKQKHFNILSGLKKSLSLYLQQQMVFQDSLHGDDQQIPQGELAVVSPLGTLLLDTYETKSANCKFA